MWQAPYNHPNPPYHNHYQGVDFPQQSHFSPYGYNYNPNSMPNSQFNQGNWHNSNEGIQNTWFQPSYTQQPHHKQSNGCYSQPPKQQSFNRSNTRPNANNQCRCDPCERDFTSKTALEAHQKMHVKCEESGCLFTASSKAVKLHFIQTHAEGKFRISLQTPEEISKWREERKRNWPTVANVSRKKTKQGEDERNGILIKTKEFTYTDRERRGRGRGRNKGIRERGKGRGGRAGQAVRQLDNIDMKNSTHTESDNINNNNNNDTMDGVGDCTVKSTSVLQEETKEEEKIASSLSLLQSYGVEEQSDDEVPTDSVSASMQTGTHMADIVLKTQNENMTKSVNDDITVDSKEREDGELVTDDDQCDGESRKHCVNLGSNGSIEQQSRKLVDRGNVKRKGRNDKPSNKNKKREVSLLEMLLAKEIRHERNVILQCIYHIVNENFFAS